MDSRRCRNNTKTPDTVPELLIAQIAGREQISRGLLNT
jgi:hypothetical protein